LILFVLNSNSYYTNYIYSNHPHKFRLKVGHIEFDIYFQYKYQYIVNELNILLLFKINLS